MNPLSEARRILATDPPILISPLEWRKLTAGLVGEIERLQRGDFTTTERIELYTSRRVAERRQGLPAPEGQAIRARAEGDRRIT
jgi:hypothetical protein